MDKLLQRCEGGVDTALNYAKNMAKYMKDLIGYLEKRTALGKNWPRVWSGQTSCPALPPLPSLLSPAPAPPMSSLPSPIRPAEMDFAKGLQKIVHNCRQSVMQEVGSGDTWQGSLRGGMKGRGSLSLLCG